MFNFLIPDKFTLCEISNFEHITFKRIQNIFSDCRRGNRKGNPLLFLIQHLHCYNVHCRKWRWLEQKLAMALARLRKELKDLANGADVSGVNASPRGDDLTHLVGDLKGPEGTPYEKGVFFVDIKIPQQYPFEPPKMKFETKIWHPNISSQTGAICLDILKDKCDEYEVTSDILHTGVDGLYAGVRGGR